MFGVPHQHYAGALPPQYAGMPVQASGIKPQQYGHAAPAPQYTATAMPRYSAAPAAAPTRYATAGHQFAAPMQYATPAPQRYAAPSAMPAPMPQNASYTPPPLPVQSAQLSQPAQAVQAQGQFAPVQAQVLQQMPQYSQPPQAYTAPPPAPAGNSYVPPGGEMLQVTVFGTKQVPGANMPTVTIEIPGKHKGTIETQAITGPSMVPKSLITYIQPGEGLYLMISEGEQVLGAVDLMSEDFYPNGVEGDLPLTDPNTRAEAGHLYCKIQPLGTSGQMAELQPVIVPATSSYQPMPVAQQEAGVTVVPGTLRECSPEEFAALSALPGAPPAQPMMPGDLQTFQQGPASYVSPAGMQSQQYMPQQQMQPPQYAQQQPQYAQVAQPQIAQQPQYGNRIYR